MKTKILKSLPSLVAIQSFALCAETKSINKASGLLHKSQGAVSKQIKQLEERYKVLLFERTVAGLKLTQSGEAFLGISRALLDLVETFEHTDQGALEPITLFAPSTFTLRWLLPRIDKIRDVMGDQRLQVTSTHQDLTRLDESELQVVVIRGHGDAKGVIATELFPELLTPMCSEAIRASIIDNGMSLRG